MPPETTLSARRQTLRILPPNAMRETLLTRAFPDVDVQVLRYLSRLDGIDEAHAQALLKPHSYDALESWVLPRYHALKDFEPAAQRIADGVMRNESIGISGDYDCDGNCSTAVMIRFLQSSGVHRSHIHVHIPNRKREGYGINRDAVAAMDGKSVSLLIALDNGTLAHTPLAEAKQRGMDAVVIDHHPNSAHHPLPAGAWVVNPRRSDEPLQHDSEGVADLAAVGVTWMVCKRAIDILRERGYYHHAHLPVPDARLWLGLVATATVGDVVQVRSPLNRALVKEGLNVIREGRDPYITALADIAQIPLAQFNEESIAFRLAPIINAPGRLGQSVAWSFLTPSDATSLDTASLLDDAHAQRTDMLHAAATQHAMLRRGGFFDINDEHDRILAHAIRSTHTAASDTTHSTQRTLMMLSRESNELRKHVETAVMRQARPQARKQLADNPSRGTLFLCGDDWHEGVIGIVAGRIKEEFGLPTFVASHDTATGICKASARSIKVAGHPVDVGQTVRDLCEKEGLLLKAGGHPMAAGCSFH
ncbi:MAG: hypothetical protein C0436_04470, partial [Alphaproteobacteria bacterium]|nr:hypothetical protein [Alphaproteobacteria bacterium]